MRSSIHLAISASHITVTLRRGGNAIWQESRLFDGVGMLPILEDLLTTLPRPRWRPLPAVTVSVGPHASRIKHLRGLPNVPHLRTLNAIVRENARQFFLWDVPFMTTGVHVLSPGEALCGAIDSALVHACQTACDTTGYTLRAIYPEQDERLTFQPDSATTPHRSISLSRAIPAWSAVVIMAAAALAAPGIAASLSARRTTQHLAAIASTAEQMLAEAHTLDRDVAAIRTITTFEQHRRSSALLLAAITNALPPESAMTMLRVDTTMVDLIVISKRAADVLGALDRLPGVIAPEIIGPVSREGSGTQELERATIRLKYEPGHLQDTARVVYTTQTALE